VPLEVSTADDGSAHHVIYKRDSQRQLEEQFSDFAYMEPDRLQKRYKRSSDEAEKVESTRTKRDIPNVIYPEILVIVDYDGYRLHGGDNVQVSDINPLVISLELNTHSICRLSDTLCHFGMELI